MLRPPPTPIPPGPRRRPRESFGIDWIFVAIIVVALAAGVLTAFAVHRRPAEVCVRTVQATCHSMRCSMFNGDGTCLVWVPDDFPCPKCVEWADTRADGGV